MNLFDKKPELEEHLVFVAEHVDIKPDKPEKFVVAGHGRINKKTIVSIVNSVPGCWKPTFVRLELVEAGTESAIYVVIHHDFGIVKFRLCYCTVLKDGFSNKTDAVLARDRYAPPLL